MERFGYEGSLSDELLMLKNPKDEVETSDNVSESLTASLNELSKSQLAHLRESPAAKERRLARNAERMREKRARESYDEYRQRLAKNASNNRLKRKCESDGEKMIRHVRDAARQRLRRAMETNEQRADRLQKLAERMRFVRMNESTEKKAQRLTMAAQRSRERLLQETSEERKIRLQKSCDYARRIRGSKSKSCSISDTDSGMKSDSFDRNHISHESQEVFGEDLYVSHFPQLVTQDDLQHQKVVVQKTERSLNIPRIHQPQNHYVQFTAPMNYSNSPGTQYTLVSSQINQQQNNSIPLTVTDSNNVSYIIQPVNSSTTTTLNVPQYHTLMVQSSSCEDSSHRVKSEPCSESEMNNRPRGRPRKRSEQPLVKVEPATIETIKYDQSNEFVSPSEHKRTERLRLTAEKSRLRRMNETQEQREKRLRDLKERARIRRDLVKINENQEEKQQRLAQQAEYARTRRQKLNTTEGKQNIERKAREFYEKIHDQSQLSDKSSALKILEPIIEMNS